MTDTLYTAAQVRELDRLAIEQHGIPGLCLMERAGSAVFHCLRRRWPAARRLAVVCGIGNNAGDGYVIARLAHLAGYTTQVLQLGDSNKLKGDALITRQYLHATGGRMTEFDAAGLEDRDLIVDAVFGTGLDREVAGAWADAIQAMNECTSPIVAVDIPSGLHADTGSLLGCAVQAAATMSFIGLKRGLLTGAGPEYCGALYFDDLQVPAVIYEGVGEGVARLFPPLSVKKSQGELASSFPPLAKGGQGGFVAQTSVLASPVSAAEPDAVTALRAVAPRSGAELHSHAERGNEMLPPRPRHAHKGDFGHVLIIGGDHGYTGAARLAAQAALRCGAGKVSLATRRGHADLMSLATPEIMSHGVEDAEALAALLARADVVAVGPGLGQGEWGRAMLAALAGWDKPLVADADALNLLASGEFTLPPAILTPHPGEAARLLQISTREVQADRFAAAQAIQQRFGGVCVLKGAGTVIAGSAGRGAVCDAGNPGMACGGMGDVLTGVIAALSGQKLDLEQAARNGVCLHAAAGDKAAQAGGERGLLPTDLLDWLRRLLNGG